MYRLVPRTFYPAIIDTNVYSCTALRTLRFKRPFSSSHNVQQENTDEINPQFINRNPRNLEQMGLAKKRKGWKFQYPTRNFYHRLMFSPRGQYVRAWVEHSSGEVVLSASAGEVAIAKHLYSTDDVSAACNIGRVLAQRCRESGITAMLPLPPQTGENMPKYQAFIQAMEEGGIELSEPDEIKPEYQPGINYEDTLELEDLERRQRLAKKESNVRWGTKDSNWI